jgi:hypothetical protein
MMEQISEFRAERLWEAKKLALKKLYDNSLLQKIQKKMQSKETS